MPALQGEHALVSEFDVPDDIWFYREAGAATRGYPGLPPHIALMEMGLQPCGFLSAHLRSSLLLPEADLYFRNLDGDGRILATPDLRGRTVTNEVRMLSSVRGQGTILQSFAYGLSCEGQRFYEGEATFGYFRLDALVRQVGLDGGMEVRPWLGDALTTPCG